MRGYVFCHDPVVSDVDDEWEQDLDIELTEEDMKAAEELAKKLGDNLDAEVGAVCLFYVPSPSAPPPPSHSIQEVEGTSFEGFENTTEKYTQVSDSCPEDRHSSVRGFDERFWHSVIDKHTASTCTHSHAHHTHMHAYMHAYTHTNTQR